MNQDQTIGIDRLIGNRAYLSVIILSLVLSLPVTSTLVLTRFQIPDWVIFASVGLLVVTGGGILSLQVLRERHPLFWPVGLILPFGALLAYLGALSYYFLQTPSFVNTSLLIASSLSILVQLICGYFLKKFNPDQYFYAENSNISGFLAEEQLAANRLPFFIWLSAGVLCIAVLGGLFDNWGSALSALVALSILAGTPASTLAVHCALSSSLSYCRKSGILFRNANDIELANQVEIAVFDKSGTVTIGQPKLSDIVAFDRNSDRLLRIAASIQRASPHPIARAIVAAAEERELTISEPTQSRDYPGRGMSAVLADRQVEIGNSLFLAERGIISTSAEAVRKQFESAAKTTTHVILDGHIVGVIALRDPIRSPAPRAIASLQEMDIQCAMFTGDTEGVAEAIGTTTHLDQWLSGLTSSDRARWLENCQLAGRVCALIGEGQREDQHYHASTVMIAMPKIIESNAQTASIILLRPDLTLVPSALQFARRTVLVAKRILPAVIVVQAATVLSAAVMLVPPVAAVALAAFAPLAILGVSKFMIRDLTINLTDTK
ncbi:MAG: HAD-IC family P-type ATPase [Stappiaceae bacterium]